MFIKALLFLLNYYWGLHKNSIEVFILYLYMKSTRLQYKNYCKPMLYIFFNFKYLPKTFYKILAVFGMYEYF